MTQDSSPNPRDAPVRTPRLAAAHARRRSLLWWTVLAVGGGSHLVPAQIEGISEVIRPQNHAVANAYGAAIAEASGTVDRVFRYEEQGRAQCLEVARRLAMDAAVRSGADPDQVRITAMAEIPLTYVPGRACRVQVKAAGPLAR